MNMSHYVRLNKGVNEKGILIKPEEVDQHIEDPNQDYYTSICFYNDEQYKQFQETKSVAGIKDVFTNQLAFDFDSKADLELARRDSLELIKRLREKLNIKPNQLEIYFSGQKGFTIRTELTRMLSPERIGNLALNVLGKDLQTLDKSLYNASRILRLPNTRHQESGLFKIPITFKTLKDLSMDDIKELALKPQPLTPLESAITIPEEMLVMEEKTQPKAQYEAVDLSKKPSQWKNCKWSLAQGNFKNGERKSALMVLASTCRGLGFTKDMTYDLCKGALRRSIDKYGQGTTDKTELYKDVIEGSVFSDRWEGGSYTCKKPGWLQTYCNELGEHKCKDRDTQDEKNFVQFDEMYSNLVKFSQDFEKNIIKTGLVQLDDHLILSTSTLNGVLGQPGAGKTTMAMNYLKYSSKMGIPSVFFSLDMGAPIVSAKIIQQRTGLDFTECLNFIKNQPEEAKVLASTIMKEDYSNVNFTFRSGITAADIKEMVKQQEEFIGKKVKLVIIDYLECISSPYGDQTASTGYVANVLKDVANELEVCILLLLQTQKHSTPEVSDALLSLKGVKGSSIIEQSCTTILTLWREGYSPKYVEDDKYISFAIVKNRFGSLWSGDFGWTGVTGEITALTEEQRQELWDFRKKKKDDKIKDMEASNKGWEN